MSTPGPTGSRTWRTSSRFERLDESSERAELIPGSGIVIRRFAPTRSNPWHHAPGRYAVFTLCGAVDIEIGDGTVRQLEMRRSPEDYVPGRAGIRSLLIGLLVT